MSSQHVTPYLALPSSSRRWSPPNELYENIHRYIEYLICIVDYKYEYTEHTHSALAEYISNIVTHMNLDMPTLSTNVSENIQNMSETIINGVQKLQLEMKREKKEREKIMKKLVSLKNLIWECMKEFKAIVLLIMESHSSLIPVEDESAAASSSSHALLSILGIVPDTDMDIEHILPEDSWETKGKDYVSKLSTFIQKVFLFLLEKEKQILERETQLKHEQREDRHKIESLIQLQRDNEFNLISYLNTLRTVPLSYDQLSREQYSIQTLIEQIIEEKEKSVCFDICKKFYEQITNTIAPPSSSSSVLAISYPEMRVDIVHNNCEEASQYYIRKISDIWDEKCMKSIDKYFRLLTDLATIVKDCGNHYYSPQPMAAISADGDRDENIMILFNYIEEEIRNMKKFLNDIDANIREKEISLISMIETVQSTM